MEEEIRQLERKLKQALSEQEHLRQHNTYLTSDLDKFVHSIMHTCMYNCRSFYFHDTTPFPSQFLLFQRIYSYSQWKEFFWLALKGTHQRIQASINSYKNIVSSIYVESMPRCQSKKNFVSTYIDLACIQNDIVQLHVHVSIYYHPPPFPNTY